MKMTIIRQRSRRSGFTLLELLLVVGILVMLAAFALPSFLGTQEQAQKDAVGTQVKMFENVLNVYRTQNGTFPSTDQGLRALLVKPEEDPVPKKWAGPYLSDENLSDPWGFEYQYAYPGEHNVKKKPDIWSVGPDGEEGTEDDIGNWKAEEGTEETATETEKG
jgi:general secretion pathway protein G